VRHFIVHTRRAGHVVTRPLNCGVRRMPKVAHNAFITLAASFVALLAAGGVQESFSRFWPELADRFLGFTSLGTYVGYTSSALTFFAVGYFAPMWLKSRVALVWLIWPIVGLYAVFVATGPEYYCCAQWHLGFYLVAHAMFVVPLLACSLGYAVRRVSGRRASYERASNITPAA